MKQNKEVQFVDLKLIEYKEAWDLQETLLNRIATVKLANRGLEEEAKETTENYLLFCEHPHVYTLGKSGDESHLLLQESFLSTIGASYFKTNRGGDIARMNFFDLFSLIGVHLKNSAQTFFLTLDWVVNSVA